MDNSSNSSRDRLNLSHKEYLQYAKNFGSDNDVGDVYADIRAKIPNERLAKAMVKKRNEQDVTQKKTFTKWINNHLKKHPTKLVVKDLYADIKDGLMLIYLIEVLSSVELKKEKGPRMQKVHFLSNIKMALSYLTEEKKIKLININSADLVAGKSSIVLGLVWQIILYYQIQEHDFNKQPTVTGKSEAAAKTPDRSSDTTVKSKLLSWIQCNIAKTFNIEVTNFTKSWQSGIAFNALIGVFRPELIVESEVRKRTPKENIDWAFTIAEEQLGIARLLDAEDILTEKPDEKSIMTYVSQFLDLQIPRKDVPENESQQDIILLEELNKKKKQFIKDVKDSGVDKIMDTIELKKTNEFVKELQKQLSCIPPTTEGKSSGDEILESEFVASVEQISTCLKFVDESIKEKREYLEKWLSTSEQILRQCKDFERDIMESGDLDRKNEEINDCCRIFDDHFKDSSQQRLLFGELKEALNDNADSISYFQEAEHRLGIIMKNEEIYRTKLVTYKATIFLKITEKRVGSKLQIWKKELCSLEDAKEKYFNYQEIVETDDIRQKVSDSLKILSVNAMDNKNNSDWLKSYKSKWSDTELELRSVNTTLRTYIDQWNAMETAFQETETWIKKNEGDSVQQKELETGKKNIQNCEQLVAFLAEQSDEPLKQNLNNRLVTLRGNFHAIIQRDTESKMDKLSETIDDIKERTIMSGEIIFPIYGIDNRMKTAKEEMLSPYFYSHNNGYKVRLEVYPGGDYGASGTHLSVYIQICKGEYDDLLPWPCKYSFHMSVVNQRSGATHNTKTWSHNTVPDNCKDCFDKPNSGVGYGYTTFISHSDLRSIDGLIINDRINIKCIVTPP